MKRRVFSLMLSCVLVLSCGVGVLAAGYSSGKSEVVADIGISESASEIREVYVDNRGIIKSDQGVAETDGNYREVYIKVPVDTDSPVKIYDGDLYLGTVDFSGARVNASTDVGATWVIDWTISGGVATHGTVNHTIADNEVSWELTSSRSTPTDVGIYNISNSTYYWLEWYSASTTFSDTVICNFSPAWTVNFAIRNNGIYSATYVGSYSVV
ncbi:MAG: hypothetical protein LBD92_05535 [Oscillospiraceae bacterium]|jgi:hypothetical protein|nr:hypothetical protein [Oscillospiraceae bacterium]